MTKKFERLRHVRYFSRSLRDLPRPYSSADANRLTLVHFCVQSLDVLGCLPDAGCCGRVDEDAHVDREAIVEWIYGLQTVPSIGDGSGGGGGGDGGDDGDDDDDNEGESDAEGRERRGGGFKGGTYLGPLPNASGPSASVEPSTNDDDGDGDDERGQVDRGSGSGDDGGDDARPPAERHPYDHSHVAMTYVALCTLVALGDDLSRVRKDAVLRTLRSLQKEDGSFEAVSSSGGGEGRSPRTKKREGAREDDDCDLRFVYAAVAIWYLLTDPDDSPRGRSDPIIDVDAAASYVLSCVTYDGSLGLTPGREGHGGSTFCGIATLHLLGVLDEALARDDLRGWREDLVRWCVSRQRALPSRGGGDGAGAVPGGREPNGHCEADGAPPAGMAGRPNKLEDTCYSYWIGGTLHLLGESGSLDGWALREYVLTCQSPYGGFGKVVGAMPDILHSFYSLAWLALSEEQGCCDEELDGEGGAGPDDVGYESERRQQVRDSIGRMSKLDCALGMCAKRTSAYRKATAKRSD